MSREGSRRRTPALLSACLGGALVSVAPPALAQSLAPPPPLPPSQGAPSPGGPPPSSYPAGSSYPTGSNCYTPPTETTERLDQSERDDSGRGLEFFYANASAGVSGMGFSTFHESDLALARTSAVGGVFDVGAGLRLLVFSFGPRLRYTVMSPFSLWQINGEAAFHIPVGRWDGYIGVHGGYSFVGSLSQDAVSGANSDDVKVRGFDAGLQLGLDYYMTPHFSIGGEISGEGLFLSRPGVDKTTNSEYLKDGSSAGLGGLFALHAGVHL